MSDSVVTGTGFNRSDLTQDISRALENQGKLEYVQVVKTYYPARSLTPREYAHSHLTKGKVKCVYVGPADEVPKECPKDCDLLAVIGLSFTRRESEDVAELLNNAETSSRVLIGVPLQVMPGSAQLKELAVLGELAESSPYNEPGPARDVLISRRDTLRRQMLERLKKFFAPSAFKWIYEGEVLEEAPAGSRNVFFSGVLQHINSLSPRMRAAGSRRERREAIDEMLELSAPLQLPMLSKRGSSAVLRRMLADHGILETVKDSGGYITCQVRGLIPDGDQLASVWNMLLKKLVGDGRQTVRTNLFDLVRELRDKPYGLSLDMIGLLIASAIRRFNPDFDLEKDDEFMVPSGVALRGALNAPKGWYVRFHPASDHECAFLRAVETMFASEPGTDLVNIWENAKKAVLGWYEALPVAARSPFRYPGDKSKSLALLIRDKEKTASARDMFAVWVPKLCGENGIPLENEQESMLSWLRDAKNELDGYLKFRENLLLAEMGRVFGGSNPPDEDREDWFSGVYKRWFDRLYPGTRERRSSRWASALIKAAVKPADSAASFEAKWFVELPDGLELPPITEWASDHGSAFLARILNACLELELWHIKDLFPVPEHPERRKEVARAWLEDALDGMKLSTEQRESVILDLMENFCWESAD